MPSRAWLPVALAALLTSLPGLAEGRLLAVLEFQNKLEGPEAKSIDAGYLTNVVRSSALEALPGLRVMTRENMLVLVQASGKSLADCEGECEVDTGRRLGADLVVSGELLKFGSKYKLDLRMHDTRDGRLVSGAQASGRTIDELDEASGAAVKKLLLALQPPAASSNPAAPPAAPAAPTSKSAASGSANPQPAAPPPPPSLARKLLLRLEAIHNATFLEGKACKDFQTGGHFPIKSESDVLALCPRFGDRFDLELFDKPHEVDAVADGDPAASYRVKVGCRTRCACLPKVACFSPEAVYLGMVGEALVPEINSATVKADYDLVDFSDEARGIYGAGAKMCLLNHPKADEVARACADAAAPSNAQKLKIIAGKRMTLLGETSGALIPIDCEFHCGCDGTSSCGVVTKPTGFNVQTYGDVAEKLKRATPTLLRAVQGDLLPPGESILYLSPPAHRHPAEKN